MEYLAYTNADEKTQTFISILLITSMLFVFIAGAYYWISDKIKV